MMEAVRTSETSVDNQFTRQYIPEDNSELIRDDGGSTHLWNVGRQSIYTAVYPRRQFWTHPWWWRQYAPLKRRSTINLHGSVSQKTILNSSLMMEAVRTSETSVDNQFTRQYIPEDNSEHELTCSLAVRPFLSNRYFWKTRWVDDDGVRLRLWTARISGPIVRPPGDTWAWRTIVEWCQQRKTDSSTRALRQSYQQNILVASRRNGSNEWEFGSEK
jgi:hypothetical protein